MKSIFRYVLAASTILSLNTFETIHSMALADDCLVRFQKLISEPKWDTPAKTRISSKTGDGPIFVSETIANSWDHQVTVPQVGPRSLSYNGGIFLSEDQGKSWKKIHQLEMAQTKKDTLAGLKLNAASASNVNCRQEKIEGKSVDVLEGNVDNVWPAKSRAHYVLYVAPNDDFVVKNISTITLPAGLVTRVENDIERIEVQDLPKPE